MSEWIIDISDNDLAWKEQFLKQHAGKKVVMDLTCFDPRYFYAHYPQLKGVFSALLTTTSACEAHFESEQMAGMQFLESHGFTPHLTTVLTPGFVCARIVATIINEAYYSLADGIASAADIDRAMKFGVNYPQGPIAWAKGREHTVVRLLTTLQEMTGDNRYQPAGSLRLKTTGNESDRL